MHCRAKRRRRRRGAALVGVLAVAVLVSNAPSSASSADAAFAFGVAVVVPGGPGRQRGCVGARASPARLRRPSLRRWAHVAGDGGGSSHAGGGGGGGGDEVVGNNRDRDRGRGDGASGGRGAAGGSLGDIMSPPPTVPVVGRGAGGTRRRGLTGVRRRTGTGGNNSTVAGTFGDIMASPYEEPVVNNMPLRRRRATPPPAEDDGDKGITPLATRGGATVDGPVNTEEDGGARVKTATAMGANSRGVPAEENRGDDDYSGTTTTGRWGRGLSSPSPTKSGLVTDSGGTLQSRFGGVNGLALSPLDRIALTANGNLQRIFSSYYDAPVQVHVDMCERRRRMNHRDGCVDGRGEADGVEINAVDGAAEVEEATWDRRVHLTVHSKVFCTATSEVTVRDPECIRLVESGEVGIGQLFRYLDKLPTFELIDAGRRRRHRGEDGNGGGMGGLWRRYVLRCDELTCSILEEFEPDAWDIMPPEGEHFEEHDNTF